MARRPASPLQIKQAGRVAFSLPIISNSATQEARFLTIWSAKDDVGILGVLIHAEMKRVIRRFELASHDRLLGALMLIVAADIRPGLAMLHNSFCFHKAPDF